MNVVNVIKQNLTKKTSSNCDREKKERKERIIAREKKIVYILMPRGLDPSGSGEGIAHNRTAIVVITVKVVKVIKQNLIKQVQTMIQIKR